MKKTAAVLSLTALLGMTAQAQTKPVTLTGFYSDTNPNWANMQDEVGKVITQKTGVTLKMEYPVGSADEKINLMAASGQFPCLIQPKTAAGVLVDAEAMTNLEPLINQYAPNLKRVMGNQLSRLRYSSKDPSIYFIPIFDTIGGVPFDNDAAFKIQLGALKEQGYPRPKTLADFEKIITTYVAKHPKTADGKPTIGLSLLADDWRFIISTTNPANAAAGHTDDGEWYINPTTLAAQPFYFRPAVRAYFKWLNGMNAKGLLDPESFTQKYDQYIAKIAQGRVVALTDANWQIGSATDTLRKAGQFDKMYGRFGITTNASIKSAYNAPTGFRPGYGVGITKQCADPVAAIKLIDFMSSDEGQILQNWGIKGKHWTVVNGKRELLPGVQKLKESDPAKFQRTTGIGNYYLSVGYGPGVKDKAGLEYNVNGKSQILDTYTPADLAALKAYKATFWGDLLPKASEFKPTPWGQAWTIQIPADNDLTEFSSKEQDIVKRYIPRAILGKPTDFDKNYDAMLNDLTRQTGKYWPMMSQLVKDRITLWSK